MCYGLARGATTPTVTEVGMSDPMGGPKGLSQHLRYTPLLAAISVGLVVALLTLATAPGWAVELGAIGFFAAYLFAVAIAFGQRRFSPSFLRSRADQSDIPGRVILLVALGTLAIAIGSLFVLLNTTHPDRTHVTLGLLSIALGWGCIHTMFGFHYAYEYYGTGDDAASGSNGPPAGGLAFPGKDAPDGLSFLYFSFVVAMTAQVSDVARR